MTTADAGMTVYNANNIIQLTSSFKNIQFIDKATYTCDISAYDYGWGDTSVPLSIHEVATPDSYKDNLFAFRCENGKYVTWEETHDQVGNYPPYNPGPAKLLLYGEPGAIVTIYRFNYLSIPSGNYFELRDSSGNLVFSDNGKFMKVIDSVCTKRTGDFSSAAWNTILRQTYHTSSVKTAIAMGNACWQRDHGQQGDVFRRLQLSFKFDDTVTTGMYRLYFKGHYGDSSTSRLFADPNYQYMVLDVTGL